MFPEYHLFNLSTCHSTTRRTPHHFGRLQKQKESQHPIWKRVQWKRIHTSSRNTCRISSGRKKRQTSTVFAAQKTKVRNMRRQMRRQHHEFQNRFNLTFAFMNSFFVNEVHYSSNCHQLVLYLFSEHFNKKVQLFSPIWQVHLFFHQKEA